MYELRRTVAQSSETLWSNRSLGSKYMTPQKPLFHKGLKGSTSHTAAQNQKPCTLPGRCMWPIRCTRPKMEGLSANVTKAWCEDKNIPPKALTCCNINQASR